jgi:uncharacterized protein YbjT (DUF2867 family)
MRILIAGATGAIGRPLVRRLRANQHEVFALTRSPDSAPAFGRNASTTEPAKFIVILLKKKGVDVVLPAE